MRILLTGHSCAPDMGSEPGITWNWAVNLARSNEIWVITNEYYRAAIERYLAANPIPTLHFVYTRHRGWWDKLRLPSQRGIRIHYLFWKRQILQLARELDAQHDFDLVHHVSWSTISAPPLLWQLGKPFVWGPIGGGQTTPTALLGCYGAGLPAEMLRTLRVRLLPFLPGLRRAVGASEAVFPVNCETAEVLRRAGAAPAPLVLDVGVPRHVFDEPLKPRPTDGSFVVLWAGRIEPRKGLVLGLKALRLVDLPNVRLVIVGGGPHAAAARRWALRLGLDGKVDFLGQRPWPEVQALYRSAHVFLFTSVRDTSGTVAIEALAGGTPVICIDHQGIGAHLPDDAAVKIPVAGVRATAAAMALAIEALARDRAKLEEMSGAARRYAETESWDRRVAAMQARYTRILGGHQRSTLGKSRKRNARGSQKDPRCGTVHGARFPS